MTRDLFETEHDLFRDAVRQFVAREVTPNVEEWRRAGRVDRGLFEAAGAAGFLGIAAPVALGGAGIMDFRYNMIVSECFAEADAMVEGLGISLQADIALPYLLDHAGAIEGETWIRGSAEGQTILALAMTEPGAGSDLAGISTTARHVDGGYLLNGSKTFVTNALNCDLVIVAAKTSPHEGHRGLSLFVVETDDPGVSRGPKLAKVGQSSADTADLFLDGVHVPATNLLGAEGEGFYIIMKHLDQERLIVAVQAVAQARRALEHALEYSRTRHAFGQPIGSFQHNRFTLAEMKAEVDVAGAYVDSAVEHLLDGELTPAMAAQAKWWATEMCQRVVDRAVQLHGGYGYMLEYPVARAWVDTRVQSIYAGTTEMMKEIVGRSLSEVDEGHDSPSPSDGDGDTQS